MATPKRQYQQTHPWITFHADLTPAPAVLWLLLGEARSKCEHVAGVPLQPEAAAEFLKAYLIKGVRGTAAIEGNMLTEEEIGEQIDGALQVPPSREYQKQEIANLLSAFNGIVRNCAEYGPHPAITPTMVCHINQTILQDLKLEDGSVAGEIRKHQAGVFGYRGAPAEDCEFLLGKLCAWLEELGQMHKDLGQTGTAILKAVLAHLYLEWIHPFGDGNGRTGRLLEFYILLNSGGVPLPSAHLLSDYYNQTRSEYYRQLDAASKSGGKIIPFLLYAVGGLAEELKKQVDAIRAHQFIICWRDFINERFENLNSATQIRRRHLVLDLVKLKEGVSREQIELLSPRVAKHYATKSSRTLMRDLNALLADGCIAREGELYRAKVETIYGFLPPRWHPPMV